MQFDVHENRGRAAEFAPYLIDLQHDRTHTLRSVVVAPLLPFDARDDLGRLTPVVTVEGHRHLISIAEIFAIDRHRLGRVAANLDSERERIIAALDFLFTGV